MALPTATQLHTLAVANAPPADLSTQPIAVAIQAALTDAARNGLFTATIPLGAYPPNLGPRAVTLLQGQGYTATYDTPSGFLIVSW